MGRVNKTISSQNEQFISRQTRWHCSPQEICKYISDLFQKVFWTLVNWHISVGELTLDVGETTSCPLSKYTDLSHTNLSNNYYHRYTKIICKYIFIKRKKNFVLIFYPWPPSVLSWLIWFRILLKLPHNYDKRNYDGDFSSYYNWKQNQASAGFKAMWPLLHQHNIL